MFCVNSSSVVNPRLYFARHRASQPTKSAEDPSSGFGLQLETISDQPFEQPELDFIHDRWPQFTHRTTEWTTTLLYYVNEGTIIQECVIKKSTAHKEPSNGQKDDIKVQSHQNQASQASEGHINDNQLDANQSSEKSNQPHPDSRFSQDWHSTRTYVSMICTGNMPKDSKEIHRPPQFWRSKGYGVIISKALDPDTASSEEMHPERNHNVSTEEQDRTSTTSDTRLDTRAGYESVALAITVFVNGRPHKFQDRCENGDEIMPDWSQYETTLRQSGSLRITAAYKLLALESNPAWTSVLVKAADVSPDKVFSGTPYRAPSISDIRFLDFIMRRNLEHVLTVCSIRVRSNTFRKLATKNFTDDSDATPVPIALTCGDISGHRVTTDTSV